MVFRINAILRGCACILFLSGCGEPAYDLSDTASPGEIVRCVTTMTFEEGTFSLRQGDQILEGTAKGSLETVVEIDTLEVKDGQPTRLRVATLSSLDQSTMSIGGEIEETQEVSPLAGRSVLLTKGGETWSGRLVGGAPSPEQTAAITELAESYLEGDVLPDREVRVGDSWSVGGDALRRYLGGYEAAGFSGQMTIHFEQLVEFNGETCALLSLQLDATGKCALNETVSGTMKISGEGHIYRSLAQRLDVSARITGSLNIQGELFEDGQRVQMSLHAPLVITETMTRDQ